MRPGAGRAPAAPAQRLLPEEALDVLLAVAQVPPSVQGGVGDQQQAPRPPHAAPGRARGRCAQPGPARPGPPLPAPPVGRGVGLSRRRRRCRCCSRRPGPAMLDFAIFAVTFLLILVGAVLYLYPVMLPAAGRAGRPGPARPPVAGGQGASGCGAEPPPRPGRPRPAPAPSRVPWAWAGVRARPGGVPRRCPGARVLPATWLTPAGALVAGCPRPSVRPCRASGQPGTHASAGLVFDVLR